VNLGRNRIPERLQEGTASGISLLAAAATGIATATRREGRDGKVSEIPSYILDSKKELEFTLFFKNYSTPA